MPGNLIATSTVTLDSAVDYDLVRVTTGGNCLWLNPGFSGRIGRLELTNTSGSGDCLICAGDTWTGSATIGIPTPGFQGGGFLHQVTKQGSSHNDTCQARHGNWSGIHLYDMVVKGPDYGSGVNSSQGVLFQNSGTGHPGPTNVVFHRSVWCGRFSNPVNWGSSNGCGLDSCYVIGEAPNYTGGSLMNDGGGANPVNVNNLVNLPNTHPTIDYAYVNQNVPWLGAATGGGTFPRTAAREIIVIRSSQKAVARSRTASRDHAEQHSVILSGGTDINRPRQADRLAAVTSPRTVAVAPDRTASRLPDVTRSAILGGVIYTQWTVPWTTTNVNPGCTVTIGQGNRVAAFTNQATAGDIARAVQSGAQYIPGDYVKGKLRFRFTGKAGVFGFTQGIFAMRAGSPGVFRFAFDNAGDRLTAVLPRMGGGATNLTIPDMLGTSPVIGQTYLLEWIMDRSTTATQFYELKVDGAVVATGTPAAASTIDVLTNFFAGFSDAQNVDGVLLGVTVEVWNVVLANANVTLPDEPTPGGDVTGEGVHFTEPDMVGQGYLVGSGSI